MTAETVVTLQDVDKTYPLGQAKVRALDGVTLAIGRGKFTVLSGPSGSGKTTLLHLVGCIDRPDSGGVRIDGVDVNALDDNSMSDFRARHIGFIFQHFSLIPVLTAYENVEYPLILANAAPARRKEKVLRMLEAVGLAEQHGHRPNQLSGGQRQRVAIARALVKEPTMVLADEPTANLDSVTGKAIVELMRDMQRKTRVSFIFSSHDPMLIAQADDSFVIRDGRIRSAAPKAIN